MISFQVFLQLGDKTFFTFTTPQRSNEHEENPLFQIHYIHITNGKFQQDKDNSTILLSLIVGRTDDLLVIQEPVKNNRG